MYVFPAVKLSLISVIAAYLLRSKENNIYVFPAVKLSLISVIAGPNITY